MRTAGVTLINNEESDEVEEVTQQVAEDFLAKAAVPVAAVPAAPVAPAADEPNVFDDME
jgi:hypothetical protein